MSIDGGRPVPSCIIGPPPPRLRPRRRERRRRRPYCGRSPLPGCWDEATASLPGSGPELFPTIGDSCCGRPPSMGARRLRRRRLRGVRFSGVMRTHNRMCFSPAINRDPTITTGGDSFSKRLSVKLFRIAARGAGESMGEVAWKKQGEIGVCRRLGGLHRPAGGRHYTVLR